MARHTHDSTSSTDTAENTSAGRKKRTTHGGKKKNKKAAPPVNGEPRNGKVIYHASPYYNHVRIFKDGCLADEALSANTEIAAGTRIVTESPIIALPAPGNQIIEIYSAYSKLSAAQQQAIMALKPSATPQLRGYVPFIDSLIDFYYGLHKKGVENLTAREKLVYAKLGRTVYSHCNSWCVAARFLPHRYSLSDRDVPARDQIPAHVTVSGLFLTAAKIRHSCIPNCFATYNTRLGKMLINTIKAISADEELTLSSLGSSGWYHTAAERARMLEDAGRPICICPACDPDSPVFSMQDRIRGDLHIAMTTLGPHITLLQAMDKWSGPSTQSLPPNIMPPTRKTLRDICADVHSMLVGAIRDLEAVGCADSEIVRWRNSLILLVLPGLDKWVDASVQAHLILDDFERLYGKDHPKVQTLREQKVHLSCIKDEFLKELREEKKRKKEAKEEQEKNGKKVKCVLGSGDTGFYQN
jgi:hypothetical protein